ncbi:unnamed protein product, partial [Linum tenue]
SPPSYPAAAARLHPILDQRPSTPTPAASPFSHHRTPRLWKKPTSRSSRAGLDLQGKVSRDEVARICVAALDKYPNELTRQLEKYFRLKGTGCRSCVVELCALVFRSYTQGKDSDKKRKIQEGLEFFVSVWLINRETRVSESRAEASTEVGI